MNNATDLFTNVSVSSKSPIWVIWNWLVTFIVEDDKKPVEDMKPKTRVEYTDYAKRLSEVILANSVSGFTQTGLLQRLTCFSYRKVQTTASSLTNLFVRSPPHARIWISVRPRLL